MLKDLCMRRGRTKKEEEMQWTGMCGEVVVQDKEGAHSWQAYLVLWPYSHGSRFISAARRKWSKEPLHTKISEGW